VVDLISYCEKSGKKIPFELQTSVPNSGRYDSDTVQAMKVLSQLSYPYLKVQTSTQDCEQYLNFFKHGICLLLYDEKHYHDKFSGVTLDAFNNGCPVITARNTWMGEQVLQYHAGIVVDDYSPQTVLAALENIIKNYVQFSVNATIAAEQLEKIHNPKYTLDLVTSVICQKKAEPISI
ncbi:MAG: glycosyltransferase, partial [Gammaproteobacteria bacterium]